MRHRHDGESRRKRPLPPPSTSAPLLDSTVISKASDCRFGGSREPSDSCNRLLARVGIEQLERDIDPRLNRRDNAREPCGLRPWTASAASAPTVTNAKPTARAPGMAPATVHRDPHRHQPSACTARLRRAQGRHPRHPGAPLPRRALRIGRCPAHAKEHGGTHPRSRRKPRLHGHERPAGPAAPVAGLRRDLLANPLRHLPRRSCHLVDQLLDVRVVGGLSCVC